MPYKNKEDNRKWQRDRRKIHTKKLREFRINNEECDYCGWDEHPEILQFHHLDKNNKKFSFSCGGMGNYSWNTILNEIGKCVLICPNCHMWLHFKETAV